MILQTLYAHYLRLQLRGEMGLPLPGYSQEKISYCISLSNEGDVLGVIPLLDTTGKKPAPLNLSVPQPEKRTSGIRPNFMWDKTSYVLGVSAASKRVGDEHLAFKAAHLGWLSGQADPGLHALASFLERWTPSVSRRPCSLRK